VSSIQRETPADAAGLKRYDVILEVNGQPVKSEDQFRRVVADASPGSKISMKVLREKKTMDVECTLGERAQAGPTLDRGNEKADHLGLKVTDLTADLRRKWRIQDEISGVIVTPITPGEIADAAGLSPGDVIVEVNKRPVQSASQFEKQLHDAKRGDVLLLYVNQDGQFTFITLAIQ